MLEARRRRLTSDARGHRALGRAEALDNSRASVFIDLPMQAEILSLKDKILSAISGAADADALEAVRIEYLARSGALPILLEKMGTLPREERPLAGRAANETKTAVQAAYEARKAELAAAAEATDFDPTLPGRFEPPGSLHPVLQVRDRTIEIFRRLGFALADGPDIENEVFNFDALNTPPDHPARNEQDTFYLKEDGLKPSLGLDGKSPGGRRLMRTQTSTVQIRAMLERHPPIRIIAPGRCYRRDEIDATHGMSFFQMEGLVVDEGVTLGDLKGTLEFFFRELLGEDLKFRFRPHFFPFTEPSFEIDCARPGTKVRGKEWLEICGCGMVDPAVFQQVGYDAERYTGYAFGFGIERIAILLHGIPDLRLFSENDVRFLRQFSTRIDA
jgi:phenylalanyl-tRNA synthetase alpha chain